MYIDISTQYNGNAMTHAVITSDAVSLHLFWWAPSILQVNLVKGSSMVRSYMHSANFLYADAHNVIVSNSYYISIVRRHALTAIYVHVHCAHVFLKITYHAGCVPYFN